MLQGGRDLDFDLLYWEEITLRSQVLSIQMHMFDDRCLNQCLNTQMCCLALILESC